MKIRDSGMPDEEYWESLFDVRLILSNFGIERFHDVAELGCGYGTFSIPVAKAISGTLYTFDIDPTMVARTLERGIGLPINTQVAVTLLRHAAATGGEVLVIHWRHGIATPGGPNAEIRPRPDQ